MPAPTKISRVMAALLIHDLDHHLAGLASNGVKLPALLSRFVDRLSRADAQALLKLGMVNPQLQAALKNSAHPDHRAVVAYKDLMIHFAADHPQEGEQPAAWSEGLSFGMRARLADNRPFEAGEVSEREAAAYLDYLGTRGDLQAIMSDRGHADHGALVEGMSKLMERSAAPADPAVAAHSAQIRDITNGAVPPPAAGAVADAREQIRQLHADPAFMAAYLSRQSPGHGKAIEKMAELHERLVSPAPASGAAPAADAGAAPDVAALQEKIATISGQLARYSISAPGRAARGAARAAVLTELQAALDAGQAEADAARAAGTEAPA
jgi:hypothetical protein